jgi:carbon catabolite-derepressing protein kinase
VTPGKTLDFEMIDGLGRIEEDVVEALALRMEGVDKEDVWACLRRDDGVQGNAIKVAYMLLRDKRRLGQDCEYCLLFPWRRSLSAFFSGGFRGTGT